MNLSPAMIAALHYFAGTTATDSKHGVQDRTVKALETRGLIFRPLSGVYGFSLTVEGKEAIKALDAAAKPAPVKVPVESVLLAAMKHDLDRGQLTAGGVVVAPSPEVSASIDAGLSELAGMRDRYMAELDQEDALSGKVPAVKLQALASAPEVGIAPVECTTCTDLAEGVTEHDEPTCGQRGCSPLSTARGDVQCTKCSARYWSGEGHATQALCAFCCKPRNPQDPAVVVIRDQHGETVRAQLFGSSGWIKVCAGPARVENLIARATAGLPFRDAYEPVKGHVRARVWRTGSGDRMLMSGHGRERLINLRDAILVSFE